MTDCNFLERSISIIQQAIAEDRAEDYENALEHYKLALQGFMAAIRHEKNETSKRIIREKMKSYLERAEQLKELLQKSQTSSDDGNEKKEKCGESERYKKILEGVLREKPQVQWENVIGLVKVKEALKEGIIIPLKFPDLCKSSRSLWRSILLYGPPGTGKTYLAKAVATQVNSAFAVSACDFISKWVGDGERLVRCLFEMAKAAAPAVIIIDDIDLLSSGQYDNESSTRIMTELLVQMDSVGVKSGVLVLGVTNLPWRLNPAIRLRFEKRLYTDLPDIVSRQQMFESYTKDCSLVIDANESRELAKSTDGYSASDIAVCVRQAMFQTIRTVQSATHFKQVSAPDRKNSEIIRHDFLTPCPPDDPDAQRMSWTDIADVNLILEPPVGYPDFKGAIRDVRPSLNEEEMTHYREWTAQFASADYANYHD